MATFLAIRFSAIGDVAMTVPVIHAFANAFPQHKVIVVSQKRMQSLFSDLAPNVEFYGVDVKKLRTLSSIFRLFLDLKKLNIDYVADLHNVPRSQLLRRLFFLSGTPSAHIHKGRRQKWQLTRCFFKKRRLLKSTFLRYRDVFARLGFDFYLRFEKINQKPELLAETAFLLDNQKLNIGIAPFARHKNKIYPLYLQEKVIEKLSQENRVKIFLFGFGDEEKAILNAWQEKFENVVSLAGKFDFPHELAIMSQLRLMLTMDSANMHLASLTGTQVLSVWGATHPFCGFLGWGQTEKLTISRNLPCRPCSIYGKTPCRRGDLKCLNSISPEKIVGKINHILFSDPEKISSNDEIASFSNNYKKVFAENLSEQEISFVENLPQNFFSQGEILQNVRNTLKIFELENGKKIVVKRYHKPIFINRIIYGFWRKSKAARAFDYALQLREKNIATPAPIAYLENFSHGLFSDSFFINSLSDCQFMYNHLALYPDHFAQKIAIAQAIGRFTARMHEAGFFHKDFSGGNILFSISDEKIQVEVIDLNRMSLGKVNFSRALHSFERLLGDEDLLISIMESYAKERGFLVENFTRKALKIRKKHLKKNGSKYLSAIFLASYFSPLNEKIKNEK